MTAEVSAMPRSSGNGAGNRRYQSATIQRRRDTLREGSRWRDADPTARAGVDLERRGSQLA